MPIDARAGETASDDPVIYFTLIDFLVQIIFCALILFVIFQAKPHARPQDKPPGWVDDPVNLPLMRDMTPFITIKKEEELRELLRRLRDAGALEQFLEFLRKSPDPRRVIDQCRDHPDACKRFGTMTTSELGKLGVGKPSCLAGDPALLSVEAYDDRLVVAGISETGATILKSHKLSLRPQQVIPKAAVARVLSPLAMPDCRYSIRYVKRGDSEDMRHLTEQAVRLTIVRSASGPDSE